MGHTNWIYAVACTLLAAILATQIGYAQSKSADASEVVRDGYLLAPITTDVHRTQFSGATTAYALIHGNILLNEQAVNLKALDVEQFRTELEQFSGAEPSELRLVIRFEGFDHDRSAEESLEKALEQLGRDAGFATIRASKTYSSQTWNDFRQRFRPPASAQVEEPVVETSRIRAYAIRTNLSRALLGDATCLVEIRQPFDGRQSELSVELRDEIARAIQALGIEPNGKLCFKISSTDAGRVIVEQLFAYESSSPANTFSRELGFERMTYTHSPNGGAPQSLLGQPVPDFQLPTLEGESLTLSEYIGGKVALVSFWGVACGPCRVEAPHLSRLHQKYASDSFAIVAVNGYDESAETVDKYVRQEGLTHQIVLNGGTTATQQFQVGAYPTTFWIDREGTVIDYVVGFDEGDESAIEHRIVQMLAR